MLCIWFTMFILIFASAGCAPAIAPDELPPTTYPSLTESPTTTTWITKAIKTPKPPGVVNPLDPTIDAYPPPHQNSPLISPLGTPMTGSPDPYWDVASVELTIADLAERLDIAPGAIKVLEIAPDEFPGGDLGCPNPKETASSSPSIVTGYRVILTVDGANHEYHTRKDHIAYCGKR